MISSAESAATPIREKMAFSEGITNQETAGVKCLVVNDSDHVSIRSADSRSMLTEEREAIRL